MYSPTYTLVLRFKKDDRVPFSFFLGGGVGVQVDLT